MTVNFYINGSCVNYFVFVWSNTLLCVTCMYGWVGVACKGIGAWAGGFHYNFGSRGDYLGLCGMSHGGQGTQIQSQFDLFSFTRFEHNLNDELVVFQSHSCRLGTKEVVFLDSNRF